MPQQPPAPVSTLKLQAEIDKTKEELRKALPHVQERGEPNLGIPPHLQILDIKPSGETAHNYLIYAPDKQTQSPLTVSQYAAPRRQNELLAKPLTVLKEVFLPAGWPGSVSDDYTRYQIFDSLQAFASTIAGLLSSRAVLTGIGVGDSTASATSALLLHIAQDSTGRLATILFAARLSSALEPETKFYRLLADVFNDIAIILDCASPLFPRGGVRLGLLAAAGVLRSLCGVAAGASKASLSVHFASGPSGGSGNVAELNAKDASQETVISLLGSLVGTFVVSAVVGPRATWVVLLCLLAAHLSLNTAAVRAVRLRTLNRQRANLLLSRLFEGKGVNSPKDIGALERIFERDGVVRDGKGKVLGWARIGVSLAGIVGTMATDHDQDKADSTPAIQRLGTLLSLFPTTAGSSSVSKSTTRLSSPSYILHPSRDRSTILIALSAGSSPTTALQSWAHAILLLRRFDALSSPDRAAIPAETMLDLIQSTGAELEGRWEADCAAMRERGWDLDTPALETRVGARFEGIQH